MENQEKLNNQERGSEMTEEEIRANQAEKIVEFLDRINAFEYVKYLLDPKEGEIIPDFKQFEDFLIRLNGIARDIPIRERTTDGDKVYLSGFVQDIEVPRHEDKMDLLQYAYKKSQNIGKEDLKYLLPSVINAVHLFADGNGRTSRIIHLLLRNYQNKEEFESELQKALGKFGRSDSFDVNPGVISFELEQEVLKNHGWVYDEESPQGTLGPIKTGILSTETQELDKENPLYRSAHKVLDLYPGNGHCILTAIYMELGKKIQDVISEYGEKKVQIISPKKMLETLTAEQWEKIFNNFYTLKKEQVEILVDIFVYPEKYPTVSGGKENLRDLFVKKIQKL